MDRYKAASGQCRATFHEAGLSAYLVSTRPASLYAIRFDHLVRRHLAVQFVEEVHQADDVIPRILGSLSD
jgi:hypothetical protein